MGDIRLERHVLILLTILILGLFLRLYGLGTESLWLDEGFSARWASLGPVGAIVSAAGDVHPPLYYVCLSLWSSLFGNSEIALRSMSLIFNILSLLLCYMIAKRMFGSETGLLASLFFSLSVFQLYFSQEARPYAMLVFFSLLSMSFFLEWLERNDRISTILYVAASTLMLYTHAFGGFILLAQGGFILMQRIRNPSKPVSTMKVARLQAPVILLFTPWLCVMIFSMIIGASSLSWIPLPSAYSLAETLMQYSGYYYLYPWGLGTEYFLHCSIIASVLSLTVIGFVALTALMASKGRKPYASDNAMFVWLWFLVPVMVPFVLSYVLFPVYWTRFTAAASPAFYILASLGIRSLNRKPLKAAVIVLIILLSIFNIARYHYEINKEQWRDVASVIDASAQDNGVLLFYKDFATNGPVDYYLQSDILRRKIPPNGGDVDLDEINRTSLFIQDYGRAWLLLSHHLYYDDPTPGMLVSAITKTHCEVSHDYFVGIELYLFDSDCTLPSD